MIDYSDVSWDDDELFRALINAHPSRLCCIQGVFDLLKKRFTSPIVPLYFSSSSRRGRALFELQNTH